MSISQDEPAQSAGSKKHPGPRGRKAANPEARMPLIEHIRELRNRVLKAAAAMLAGAIAGWFIEPPVWNLISRPFCKLPAHYVTVNVNTGKAQTCHNLVVTGLFDSLFIHLKLAIVVGLIISSPLWLYQLWAFVAPGLHRRERRWTYFFAGSAIPLFALGGVLAYFAMSKGLRFLLSLLPADTAALINVNSYLGYAVAMLLIFGLAFELPLVMVLLNVAGVLTHERFAKWRRMIIFGVFAFAAIATPSPDPISMLLLAVPCILLVELAEVFAWINDRRRARLTTAFPGLTEDEIAEYGLDQDPLAAVGSDEPSSDR
ncbi:MAG TPA: twin-arginine translocase subunit TatC [Streptosporangiaceae bacterium]|nr:twin-arginine translocase subunit TatC [Streptosporangiaceae bacterium]